MKKIMIIGAGDFQLPLVQKASESFEVVLVAPKISDEFDHYVSKKYIFDVRDKENILKAAQSENIDAVITDQTDIPVRTVAYVAEKMGLHGIGYEVSKVFTDKYLMRDRLVQSGIDVIPFVKADSYSQAESFVLKNGFPVIVKPLDTQGSRGVIRVDSLSGLKDAFDEASRFSTGKNVLVERYITGPELVIEGITVNYETVAQICGDTIYFDDKSKFSAKKRIFPSRLDESLVNQALELNKKIIKAFSLNNGITHGEYIIDGDKVYLIEIAARGGGVYISSDLIHEETGLETEQFLIDIACGKTDIPDIANTGKVAGYRAFYIPSGEITEIRGVEEVKSFPFVRRNQLDNIKLGMTIGANTNKTSRFALIIVADSYEKWEEYEALVKQTLHVKSVNGDSTEDIIWE